jgi:peptide/nickel transport system permease protein
MSSVGALNLGWSGWLVDLAWHLPLPALALALPIAATFERLQAQSISETVHQPFVLAAMARGVTRNDIIVRHAWRASLRPICAIYGLVIGALLSGSFVVEYVTAWPGLGRLMFEALRARDIYLVAGCAALGGLFLAIGSIIADLLLAAADPRVRDGDAT